MVGVRECRARVKTAGGGQVVWTKVLAIEIERSEQVWVIFELQPVEFADDLNVRRWDRKIKDGSWVLG